MTIWQAIMPKHTISSGNSQRNPRKLNVIIAVLNERDFARARLEISGLRDYSSYDGYMFERDGFMLGYWFAGEVVAQVPISLDAFRSWCAHTGASYEMESLDVFARIVAALLDGAMNPIEICVDLETNEGPAGSRSVSAATRLYREWLGCIAAAPGEATRKAYVRMLAETWTSGTGGRET